MYLYKADFEVFQEFWKNRVLGETMHCSVPCDDSLQIAKDLLALAFVRFLPKLDDVILWTVPYSDPITRWTLDRHTSFIRV